MSNKSIIAVIITMIIGLMTVSFVWGMKYQQKNTIQIPVVKNDCLYYQIDGIVIGTIDEETIIEDTTGNLWGSYETNYKEGEKVSLLLFDNYSINKEDDEIISIIRR